MGHPYNGILCKNRKSCDILVWDSVFYILLSERENIIKQIFRALRLKGHSNTNLRNALRLCGSLVGLDN